MSGDAKFGVPYFGMNYLPLQPINGTSACIHFPNSTGTGLAWGRMFRASRMKLDYARVKLRYMQDKWLLSLGWRSISGSTELSVKTHIDICFCGSGLR